MSREREISTLRRGLCAALLVSIIGATALKARASQELDEALSRARSGSQFLVVVLIGGVPSEEAWVRGQMGRPEWRRCTHPHAQVVIRGDKSPSVAQRFGATTFPQFILLDAEGREVGRIQGKHPVEVLARRFRSIVEAAERFRSQEARGAQEASDPSPEVLYWIGAYRWNRGDRGLALESFQKVLEVAGRSPDRSRNVLPSALIYVGQNELDQKRYAQAEKHFRRALAAAREEEPAYRATFGLAMSLRRQDRVAEAILVLEEFVTSSKKSSFLDQAHFALGYMQLEAGRGEEASRHFRTCASRYPLSLYGQRAKRYLQADETEGQGKRPPEPPARGAVLLNSTR